MKKYLFLFLSLGIFLLPNVSFAASIVTSASTYNNPMPSTATFTIDTAEVGVMVYDTFGVPIGLYQISGVIGVGSYEIGAPNYTTAIGSTYASFPSSTKGTYTLLLQNGNTCWNGSLPNLTTCLADNQTIASTTFQIINATLASSTFLNWNNILLVQTKESIPVVTSSTSSTIVESYNPMDLYWVLLSGLVTVSFGAYCIFKWMYD